jgi:hypothetical protein
MHMHRTGTRRRKMIETVNNIETLPSKPKPPPPRPPRPPPAAPTASVSRARQTTANSRNRNKTCSHKFEVCAENEAGRKKKRLEELGALN